MADDRPYYALAALAALLVVAALIPATRVFLENDIVGPLRAQADPVASLAFAPGYSTLSLAFWAAVGAVLAWAAYDAVFVRMRFEPDRGFFLALAPYLAAGPLAHALLAVGAFAPGSFWAYLATEPPIYLTTAALAMGALALGRYTKWPVALPLGVGVGVLALLAALAVPHVGAKGAFLAFLLVSMGLGAAAPVAYAYTRWRRREPFLVVYPVVAAHALDGATTWMVIRDPLGLGIGGFGEKNPFSLALVSLSNGWPYFVLKLALPIALLFLVKVEPGQERAKAFLLFAVFVLGYGPGMSNLLQVMLG